MTDPTTNHELLYKTNKDIVVRFNREVIERGDEKTFAALMAPDFVNRTAPPGFATGPEGMRTMFEQVLRPALPDLRVEILDMIAEGDKVTTRKTVNGTHRGTFFGIPATGKAITIYVIDIVRIANGRYAEHWGVNTIAAVLAELRSAGG